MGVLELYGFLLHYESNDTYDFNTITCNIRKMEVYWCLRIKGYQKVVG